MKQQNHKQYAGVWMDQRAAVVITSQDGDDYTIQEKVKADEYHGDKGEHAKNNADPANSRKYYKTVATKLQDCDEIFVFGPGKSQEEFQNFLHKDAHFKDKKITLGASEHLSDPQMIARVRDFFKSH